jgi:putative SOS response-associated peptidase YedK
MEDIHNRMPAILHPEEEVIWLDRNNQGGDSFN